MYFIYIDEYTPNNFFEICAPDVHLLHLQAFYLRIPVALTTGVKRPRRKPNNHLHLVPRLRMRAAVSSLLQ